MMKKISRSNFNLRPHDFLTSWESSERRYYRQAIDLMCELELLSEEVKSNWPVALNEPIKDAKINYPDLYLLVDKRDSTSDLVRIYSAMAVEGFLNWYGSLRLGENVFNAHFERLSILEKLKMLLLVCDSIVINNSDPLSIALKSIAESRNALVHPRSREVSELSSIPQKYSKVPHTAREAVKNMELFFSEFIKVIPAATKLIPKNKYFS